MTDARTPNPAGKTPRGVLLVCYSPETLSALVAILQQSGETALVPRNTRDAWECVRTNVAGCVVLDLAGPPTEVVAFLRTVRSSSKTSSVPFLFLIEDSEQIPKFEALGAEAASDLWLVLPSSADQFLEKVRSLLSQRSAPAPVFMPRHGPAAPASETVVQPDELLNKPGSVFSGRLGVLDVTKILSMVEPLRLTGVLSVSDGKRYGQVHFVEGAVRHAELQDIEGADALFLLFHLKGGAFRFDLEQATGKRTILGNTMALLLEGLRQMDEAKAIIKAFQQNRPGAPAAETTPSVPAGE